MSAFRERASAPTRGRTGNLGRFAQGFALAAIQGMSAAAWAEADATLTLPAGTKVVLEVAETVSSASARQGQHFALTVAEDVQIDGRTVIPVGTPAVGTVLSVTAPGRAGSRGDLAVKLDYALLGSLRVRLHGTVSSIDKWSTTRAALITGALGPLGALKRGKGVALEEGARFDASTKDSVVISVAPAPAPAVSTESD